MYLGICLVFIWIRHRHKPYNFRVAEFRIFRFI